MDNEQVARFPGAEAPVREYRLDASGVGIAVHEWGDEDAPPIFLAHGGFDFARTYDVFAPKLAAAGWRVVSWDQRGHGDSDHTALYSWEADVRDAIEVFESVTSEPAPAIGHSKGGGLMMYLADAAPHRFTHLVNLDGMPFRSPVPDVAEHERRRMLASDLAGWLDHRRSTATSVRKPGTLDDLARRRRRMNPRLPFEWLRYLAAVGARHDDDGWRWKLDPSMRMGGFGPWRPEWMAMQIPGLPMPFLGILGLEPEMMGWNTKPDDIRHLIPATGQLVGLDGVGHFVHIEQPDQVLGLILDFLGS
ncbi:MAG: alpha/beta fold hydrolase [Acidimicrobiia bacterium]